LERVLWSSNVEVEHEIPTLLNSVFNWRVNYSLAQLNEPDRREYYYELHGGGDVDPYWELSKRSDSQSFTRLFGKLDEDERGFDANWSVGFRLIGDGESRAKLGYSHSYKDRDMAYRRFAFRKPSGGDIDLTLPPESLMTSENIGGGRKYFRLQELTRDTDSYTASLDVTSTYFMLDMPLLKRLRAVAGIRIEDWEQRSETFDRFDEDAEPVIASLAETDVLSSVNLTYALGEKTSLRGAYGAAISRPDLRELSPFSLDDYSSGYAEIGNPDLKRARIRNWDLRWEHYPDPGSVIATSLFYKQLIDPIETTLQIAGAQLRKFPDNGEGGKLYGAEVEARIGLERLTSRLRSFRISTNFSWVESETEVSKFVGGKNVLVKRPLAGQSPYLVNLLLFFEPRGSRISGSLIYNAFGRRLDGVGVGELPDIYEEAYRTLDLTLGLRLGRQKIKFAAVNMLDEERSFRQESTPVRRWRDGRKYSISISMGS